jgi:hypothetical protein
MTFFVDNRGVTFNGNRVFFLNAAVEEMEKTGYLSYLTLNALTHEEYMHVLGRVQRNQKETA